MKCALLFAYTAFKFFRIMIVLCSMICYQVYNLFCLMSHIHNTVHTEAHIFTYIHTIILTYHCTHAITETYKQIVLNYIFGELKIPLIYLCTTGQYIFD